MDDAAPVVVVELPAGERSSPNVSTLLRACTVALRRGACVLSSSEGQGASASATAVVTFEASERPSVLVEVRAGGQSGESTSRQIVFRSEDSESERWRSIGFTIASLAGALGGEQPEPTHEEPAPPPVEAPKPAAAPAPQARPRAAPARVPPFYLGGRFELGPGLDRGPVRFGGAMFTGYDLPGHVLSASLLFADALRSGAIGAVDMNWMRLGVGLSASAPLPVDSEGRVTVLVVAERVAASETDPATGREDSRSRWQSGVELDLALRWPRATAVGGVLGGYLVRLSGGTAVVSHGVELASSPGTGGGAFAGFELRL